MEKIEQERVKQALVAMLVEIFESYINSYYQEKENELRSKKINLNDLREVVVSLLEETIVQMRIKLQSQEKLN